MSYSVVMSTETEVLSVVSRSLELVLLCLSVKYYFVYCEIGGLAETGHTIVPIENRSKNM